MASSTDNYVVRVFETQRDQLVLGAWLKAKDLADAEAKAGVAAELFGGAAVYHVLRNTAGLVLMTTMLAAFGDVPSDLGLPD